MAASVHNAINPLEIAQQDRLTLALLDWEDAATVLGILSSLLVLVSSGQSRRLLYCKYGAAGQGTEKPPKPAATALAASAAGILSVGVLSWAALRRLQQRTAQQQTRKDEEKTGALWPNRVIVWGFYLTLAATGLKAAGVGARYAEEAAAVIL